MEKEKRATKASNARPRRLDISLPNLTDRQIGQLVFDIVWDEVQNSNVAITICYEALERLFRSSAGARPEDERFNDLNGKSPVCPVCGDFMLHFVGVGEPDFDQCQCTTCGHKCPRVAQQREVYPAPPTGLYRRVIRIIDKYIQSDTRKEHTR